MDPQFHIGDDLSALERTLKELVPTPARLDVAQTMFRAGQAAAGRSSSWRRVWPATTAMFAFVSLALGTLLLIPDQPQIVYVPVDTAPEGAPVSHATVLAAHGAADAEHILPAGMPASEPEAIPLDGSSQSSFGYLRSRALALNDRWDTGPLASQRAAIPSLRSGDWRTLIGDNGGSELSRPIDSRLPLDWTQLLNIRGS